MKFRVPIALFVFFCAVCVIAWLILNQVSQDRRKDAKSYFEAQANSFVATTKERYERNRTVLSGIEGFVNSSEEITYEEWVTNLENLNLHTNFPAISWIAYIVILPQSEKAAFIQSQQEFLKKDYQIWPESNQTESFPIRYIFPPTYNELAGYNFASNETNYALLEKSRENKEFITSGTFDGTGEQLRNSQRILFLPVIKENNNDPTGWIAASIDFSTILDQTNKKLLLENVAIKAYEGKSLSFNSLIFQKNADIDPDSSYTIRKSYEFAGVNWTFTFQKSMPSQNLITAYTFFLVLFLFLITLAVGLFLYFYYLKKSGTALLSDLPEQLFLKSTQYAFIATDTNGLITYFNPAAEKLLGYSANEMIGKLTPAVFHDQEEMKQRAEELSKILSREVKPEFEVFVALAEKSTFDNRRWIYIRKDKSRVNVQLSVTILKNNVQEVIGYLGVAIESTQIEI